MSASDPRIQEILRRFATPLEEDGEDSNDEVTYVMAQ
jgi:hypothetical protein